MEILLEAIKSVGTKTIILSIIDILIVSFVFFIVLRAIQNTRTLQLAEGICFIFCRDFPCILSFR